MRARRCNLRRPVADGAVLFQREIRRFPRPFHPFVLEFRDVFPADGRLRRHLPDRLCRVLAVDGIRDLVPDGIDDQVGGVIYPGVVRCKPVVEKVRIQAEEDGFLELPVRREHRFKGGLVHVPGDPACEHALLEIGVGGKFAGDRLVFGEPVLEGLAGRRQFERKPGSFGTCDHDLALVERISNADLFEAVDENLQFALPDDRIVHSLAPASSMISRICWIWCGIIM
ncbi:hypothetical protein DSECCO2_460160 [anaerobic digester metagenome]